MNNRQIRTSESGAVISFIIIGVVLAAIVVGGIYIVQKRGENAPVASPAATSPSTSPTTNPSSPPAETSPNPTPSKSPSKTPLPSTGVALPSTGPSDDLIGAVGFAVLLGIVIAYLRSYKFRFGSLRR